MHEVYQRETRQEGKERKQAGSGDPQITGIPGRRAAIYARTAPSQEPGGEHFSLANQIGQCQLYCQERRYTIGERHVYSEPGSGSSDPRKHPRFSSLYDAAQHHEFEVLVLASLDRLSRNQAHCAALLRELAQCGVVVECVDGDVSWLSFEIARCAAEIERARIAARAAHGRAARKAARAQQ